MKTLLLAAAAMLIAAPAAAHEVWVEKDAKGPARIYLGEPHEAVPANGDPEFPKLQKPQLVGATGALTRRANHIEAAVAGTGDVRVRDDAVFEPWAAGEGKQGAIFYARAGRAETMHQLDLELVPVAANSDSFTLMFRGKPLADAKIMIVTPDRWQKSFATDAQGRITVPSLGAGRYLVSASHTENAPARLGGQDVASVMHISTLTFVR
ncbi:DUF4198 domain-containing protein [Sphingomonas sp. HITSZ_GF]|uniref:DUF4198 domain-containing protein n=1 Tax=Sphingomonas sp. HITSZ_GF TaxID=3037247 RepID=UPI00240E3250|nr:DUF4198 domain-containing protein [Sphingomonas sp. HITSZ_GF]MDG2533436.1 DUF4198 domain-containing protein [Sphingomonas sp. HITSZ_GF]